MLLNLSILLSFYFLFNLFIKSSLTKNSVLVALYIVGSFIVSGLIYLLFNFSFIGTLLIIVYVGAVVVLFVFVSIILPLRLSFVSYSLSNIFINYSIWFFILIALFSNNFEFTLLFNFFNYGFDLIYIVGILIYTQKSLYFLMAAVLLTIAMIGAILLTQSKYAIVKNKEVINVQLNKVYSNELYFYS